ncbi:MAG: thioesterase [Kutzneria sp.]|nr:thioesterase [Kutzneria sp.]
MTLTGASEDLWLRWFQRGQDSRVEAVFFPHAGGSATYYRTLAALLPPWANALAVQYPGRQDRRSEPPIDNIPELTDRIARVLSARAERPLVFFGHSMGAVLAFEVARLLEGGSDRPLAGLIVSGRHAPSVARVEWLHRQGDAVMIEELSALGGTHAEFLRVPELWEMVALSVRADYRAIETYKYEPGPALGCPLSVLVGAADPRVSMHDAQAWERHTSMGFRFRVFPGGHFYLAEPTAELRTALAEDLQWFVPEITRSGRA